VILTVTPNPAIDMTYQVDRFRSGASVRVGDARSRAGGKGINVARVLVSVGAPVLAIAPAGGRTGQEFEEDLTTSAIPHRLTASRGATRRTVTVVEQGLGEATTLNEAGSTLSETEWRELLRLALEAASVSQCIVGSGSLPPGVPQDFYAQLVSGATRLGVPAVIDASGPALLEAAAAGAAVLKPNLQELRESTGVPDPILAARQLVQLGAQRVLVSLGARGMIAVEAGDDPPWWGRLDKPLSGNATGAGDAAVAAVADLLARSGADTPQMLRRAVGWSAAAVLAPVAGEMHPGHEDLVASVTVDRSAELFAGSL
jgi:1-phosphofructokinase family hexose kinase